MNISEIPMLLSDLDREGFSKEVPIAVVKRCLMKYVGVEKYKVAATLSLLTETGYFKQLSPGVLIIMEL